MDKLTGLPDHGEAELWLEERLVGSDSLAVALVDVDGFKQINERFLHLGGNELLKALAELLREMTSGSDLVARFGGDEFLLAWPGGDATGAVHRMETLRRCLREQGIGPKQLTITVSAGVAERAAVHEIPGVAYSMPLLRAADEALYAAKRAGRDCVRVYRPTDGLP